MQRVDTAHWLTLLGIAAVLIVAGAGLLLNIPAHPPHPYSAVAWGLLALGVAPGLVSAVGLGYNAWQALQGEPHLDRGLVSRQPVECLAMAQTFRRQLSRNWTLQPVMAGPDPMQQFDDARRTQLMLLFFESFPGLRRPIERWNRLVQRLHWQSQLLRWRPLQQAIIAGLARSETNALVHGGAPAISMSGAAHALLYLVDLRLQNMAFIFNFTVEGRYLCCMGIPFYNISGMHEDKIQEIRARMTIEASRIVEWPEFREVRQLTEQIHPLHQLLDAEFARIEILVGSPQLQA